MNNEIIFSWPDRETSVISIMKDGSIQFHENLSVMDYQEIMESMAKCLALYREALVNAKDLNKN